MQDWPGQPFWTVCGPSKPPTHVRGAINPGAKRVQTLHARHVLARTFGIATAGGSAGLKRPQGWELHPPD